jgi:hypothetical protein
MTGDIREFIGDDILFRVELFGIFRAIGVCF